ncbi:MAG: 6-pyruvoyl tetrahydrobiopterin synthase [Legionellales bacterium]|nr:6-pyruvoyl tetrahydrobiopterin synthase [Legionellales bacterium]|tara:strand:- start:459 stop:863 length:405 start_codon:yes stop_codon:yes gene_type:complete
MFQVLKQITFCYGHRLIHYSGKCQHLHGHDAVAEIVIQSNNLDQRGMVVDFSDIKADVSTWIDQHLDHKMLLCKDDPIVKELQAFGEPLFLLEGNPTAENIARVIFEQTARMGHEVVEVRLWESPTSCAVYSEY